MISVIFLSRCITKLDFYVCQCTVMSLSIFNYQCVKIMEELIV